MQNRTKIKWTVTYLIDTNGDPALPGFLKAMFDDLLSLKLNAHAAIVICMSAPIEVIKGIDPNFHSRGSGDDSDTTTLFYAVSPGDKPDGRNVLRELGRDKRFNIHNPDHVEWFFTNYVQAEFAAEHNMLFTWGHGAAYGLFATSFSKPLGLAVRPVKWPMLPVDGLAKAIKGAFGSGQKGKVDIVVTMSCYMQLLDAGLALSRAGVDFFVAPENVEMAVGFHYKALFGHLFEHPNVTPKKLARLAVTTLRTLPKPELNGEPFDPLSQTSVFVNDLRQYRKMASAVSRLSTRLKNALPEEFKAIKRASDGCRRIGGTYMLMDIFRFAARIAIEVKNEGVREAALAVGRLKGRVVIEHHYGSDLEVHHPNTHPLGISACFPPTAKDRAFAFYVTYIKKNSPYASYFSLHSHWPDFVKAFLVRDLAMRKEA